LYVNLWIDSCLLIIRETEETEKDIPGDQTADRQDQKNDRLKTTDK